MMKRPVRKGERRKGPIRSKVDRRSLETTPSKFDRRDTDRRQGDRRSGVERRALKVQAAV